jgi:hypothetical protein
MELRRCAVFILLVTCGASAACGGSASPTAPTPNPNTTQNLGWSFSPDPGVRAAGELPAAVTFGATSVVDLGDGRKRMYFTAGSTSVSSAVSTDGVEWTVEPGARLTVPAGRSVSVAFNGHVFRAFFQDHGDIVSAQSTDGLTFTREAGTRLAGYAGGWWMEEFAATYVSGQGWLLLAPRGVPVSGSVPTYYISIMLAVSQDGVSFIQNSDPIIPNSNGSVSRPSLVKSNGATRVYYIYNPGAANRYSTGQILSGTLVRAGSGLAAR